MYESSTTRDQVPTSQQLKISPDRACVIRTGDMETHVSFATVGRTIAACSFGVAATDGALISRCNIRKLVSLKSGLMAGRLPSVCTSPSRKTFGCITASKSQCP